MIRSSATELRPTTTFQKVLWRKEGSNTPDTLRIAVMQAKGYTALVLPESCIRLSQKRATKKGKFTYLELFVTCVINKCGCVIEGDRAVLRSSTLGVAEYKCRKHMLYTDLSAAEAPHVVISESEFTTLDVDTGKVCRLDFTGNVPEWLQTYLREQGFGSVRETAGVTMAFECPCELTKGVHTVIDWIKGQELTTNVPLFSRQAECTQKGV